jgi:hypothetical protein
MDRQERLQKWTWLSAVTGGGVLLEEDAGRAIAQRWLHYSLQRARQSLVRMNFAATTRQSPRKERAEESRGEGRLLVAADVLEPAFRAQREFPE